MRFLQTEWHRHERDRNAWEIDRQEMKGRIATLEGSARRGDATQKALKRYVNILEKKVKEQAAQLKAVRSGQTTDTAMPTAGDEEEHAVKQPPRIDRQALISEKLKRKNYTHLIKPPQHTNQEAASDSKPIEPAPGPEGFIGERAQEEQEREDLRNFLDQCQNEFTYLMITPANPIPPRESPPLPLDDPRDGDFVAHAGLQQLDSGLQALRSQGANHHRDQAALRPQLNPNHVTQVQQQQQPQGAAVFAKPDAQEIRSAAMVRSTDHNPPQLPGQNEWVTPGVGVAVTSREEPLAKPSHASDLSRPGARDEGGDKRNTVDPDAWDFSSEESFSDTASASSQPVQTLSVTQRPDTDAFPTADNLPKSPNRGPTPHRRKGSMSRRRSAEHELSLIAQAKSDSGNFKLRYGLRGHLDTVRTVIFSGGGSPGEPEICTAGDDGLIKRFHIPRESSSSAGASDLDVTADFTHRGHSGAVLCLTSWSPSPNFSTGGRAQGDGWIFSGGQDCQIRVWERGRVDPKATLEGHTDAVWAISVLPATLGQVFGQTNPHGPPDRILLASGAADGAVKVWAVSAPPQMSSPQPGVSGVGRRPTGSGRVRGNSMSSGSQFPSSPQPNMAGNSAPFHSTLIHDITRANGSRASPTSITPLGANGEAIVVSYSDAAIIVYDTKSGDEIGSMASLETYDGTISTSVNAVVATSAGLDQGYHAGGGGLDEDGAGGGPTGGSSGGTSGSGIEGVIISGHEDRFIRFFDANSGKHPLPSSASTSCMFTGTNYLTRPMYI
jgi:striatin 1/3/4